MSKVLDSRVELKVPVSGDYVSVIRLLISGLSNRLGLPVNEIEDLKMVVGEAFLTIVDKAEAAGGLMSLMWKQDATRITVSLTDPSGRHKAVAGSASLALLKGKGGEYTSTVVDGREQLNIDFKIGYKENRPFIFDGNDTGRA
jgi:hypothetical protein